MPVSDYGCTSLIMIFTKYDVELQFTPVLQFFWKWESVFHFKSITTYIFGNYLLHSKFLNYANIFNIYLVFDRHQDWYWKSVEFLCSYSFLFKFLRLLFYLNRKLYLFYSFDGNYSPKNILELACLMLR